MKILDKLPYCEEATLLGYHGGAIDIRPYQIVVWLRLRRLVFPAVLDTGFSGNFLLTVQQLKSLGGIASLEQSGEIEVNCVVQPVFKSEVWLHHNRPGTREPTDQATQLTIDDGIIVVPEGGTRIPILGMKAITRSLLRLAIDGKLRQVTLKTAAWF